MNLLKNGFSLVELLLGMGLVSVFGVIIISILLFIISHIL